MAVKKKEATRERRDDFDRMVRMSKTGRAMRRNLLKRRTETRYVVPLPASSLLCGMPESNSDDPLHITGLQMCLFCFPTDEFLDRWENELLVSAIAVRRYLRTQPTSIPGIMHQYEAGIIQLVDPQTSYGRLLEKQNHRGTGAEGDRFTTERTVHLRIHVRSPEKHERKRIRSAKYEVPDLILLDIASPCRPRPIDDERDPIAYHRAESLSDELSNLEVDRVWELSAALAEWIVNPAWSADRRSAAKARLSDELCEAAAKLATLEEELNVADRSLSQARAAFEPLSKAHSIASAQVKTTVAANRQRLAKAFGAVQSAKNEVGRLQGVHRQLADQLSKLKGDEGEKRQQVESRIKHVQQQRAQLPQKIRAAEQALELLKREIEPQETKLLETEKQAGLRATAFRDGEHAACQAKVLALQTELNLLKTKRSRLAKQLLQYSAVI